MKNRAIEQLKKVNYYRLSGYWYPFLEFKSYVDPKRSEKFIPGTTFEKVILLYEFDRKIRVNILEQLGPIELAIRALLGHELGRIHPLIHCNPELLGVRARKDKSNEPSKTYRQWKARFDKGVNSSHEEFVRHHLAVYAGQLPIWVAVEILDWGKLTYLFGMSPEKVREVVADECHLSPPQLESWLKSLNILRNYAAHHGRIFNRVFDLKPKFPRGEHSLTFLNGVENRLLTQLTIIEYLLDALQLDSRNSPKSLLLSFPETVEVPKLSMGLKDNWQYSSIWN